MSSDQPSHSTSSSAFLNRSPRTPRPPNQQLTATSNNNSSLSPTPNLPRSFNHPTNPRIGPSPAYTTNLRSRHALYGTDDRVVIDLGSKVWKAGFSSETNPRVVISVKQLCKPILENFDSIWDLCPTTSSSMMSNTLISDAISIGLRRIFFDHLIVDPKQRKVILIENPLIPIKLRSQISIILFDQFHVPSILYTPSPVLVLMASGILTGLVVDVGNLETTVVPVYMSRPLFPTIMATTRAGSRLNDRLKALLLRFTEFLTIPKFGQSSLSTNQPRTPRSTNVPAALLTSSVIEDIKTRLLFVSPDRLHVDQASDSIRQNQYELISGEYSEFDDLCLLDTLERIYTRSTSSDTQDVIYKLPSLQPSLATPRAPCIGVLRIPGWIRERASEILFHPSLSHPKIEEEEEESLSIPEVILETLLKLPVDLRRQMAKNLIVCGGTAMLPGFLARLKSELITILQRFETIETSSPDLDRSQFTSRKELKKQELKKWIANRKKFSSLSSLGEELDILNYLEPSTTMDEIPPSSSSTSASRHIAKTNMRRPRPPRFQMNLLAWIGGSLAGSMRIGGQEIIRERWDAIVESILVSQEVDLSNLSRLAGQETLTIEELDEEAEDNEEQIEYQRKLIGLQVASTILPDWATLPFA